MRMACRAARLAAAALIACILVTGCAAFRQTRRVDAGPFSENTLGMVGALQKLNRPGVWIHLKKYENLPSVVAATEAMLPITDLFQSVALYSSQVVRLQDAPISEEKKVWELASYLEDLMRPELASTSSTDFPMTPARLDSLVGEIRERKTLLAALGAAQHLVDMTLSVGNILFSRVELKVQDAYWDIRDRIEAEFHTLKTRMRDLDAMHVSAVGSYALIQRYRSGDPTVLDSLRAADADLGGMLPRGRPPTAAELEAIEARVVSRAATIHSMRNQLEPAFKIYRESQMELESLRTLSDDSSTLGRATLEIWARSHRNLASGIPVPPMIDIFSVVRGSVDTGVQSILP